MFKHIYRVTEKNVDGCGGDATEFISFPRALQQPEATLFANILKDVKTNAEDYDTADMIDAALTKFENASGIKGKLCNAPYEGAFEF